MKFDKDTLTGIGVILTFTIGVFNLVFSMKNNKKTQFINTITSSRINWMGELRENMSLYISLIPIHNYINVTTNAKRAIDCQIDWLITLLGYNYKNFDRYNVIQEFINKKSSPNNHINGENRKLEFINLLGLSPKMFISKYRSIRNKLEHEYREISKEEALEILELAEFFINSSDYKVKNEMIISFCINNVDNKTQKYDMYFLLDETINSSMRIISIVNENRYEIEIRSDKDLYMEMLEVVINKNYTKIPKLLGYDIPEECINIQFSH
ncbi:hypothetical protein [Clostridium thailandense]|uniref:hypothetical protein n=1 Tax=Clostridium thailandense TaxID=2794346 RepID=UPI0039890372